MWVACAGPPGDGFGRSWCGVPLSTPQGRERFKGERQSRERQRAVETLPLADARGSDRVGQHHLPASTRSLPSGQSFRPRMPSATHAAFSSAPAALVCVLSAVVKYLLLMSATAIPAYLPRMMRFRSMNSTFSTWATSADHLTWLLFSTTPASTAFCGTSGTGER